MSTLTIVKADVVLFAPELANVLIVTANWTQFLAWAGAEISLPALGTQAAVDRAGAQLVAHFASQFLDRALANAGGGQGGNGPAGPVESIRVDKVATTYAIGDAWKTAALTAAALAQTVYGREYLRLIRILMGGSSTVAGGLGPVPSGGCWGGGGFIV